MLHPYALNQLSKKVKVQIGHLRWRHSKLLESRPMDKIKINNLSVGQALEDTRKRLMGLSENPSLDAQVVLAHILGRDRAWALAHPEANLSAAQMQQWEQALARLESEEALPYVLGEWEFYGLKIALTPSVLIPRPETELLVETALIWLAANPKRRRAADVGTGSGCIAVALGVHLPDLELTASDTSSRALEVARSNFARYDLLDRVQLVLADLMEGLPGPFDLICANLPYIPSSRLDELTVARREPRLALDGRADGLTLIRGLLRQAKDALSPGGLLLAEVDDSHEESAPALARTQIPGATIDLLHDLAGKPRLLRVQR